MFDPMVREFSDIEKIAGIYEHHMGSVVWGNAHQRFSCGTFGTATHLYDANDVRSNVVLVEVTMGPRVLVWRDKNGFHVAYELAEGASDDLEEAARIALGVAHNT